MGPVYFRGATAYEAQIGRLWVRIPFWSFFKVGVMPSVGWERDD